MAMFPFRPFGAIVLLLALGRTNAGELEFNRDIRPILAENCFACHGPDSAARKADLRLDRRDDAVKAGAFVPGKADDSELVRRINATEADEIMPPPKAHKTLTAAQKKTLRDWVVAGAEYQPHWSFIAPKRPIPPAVKNEAWVRSPIDRFVLAELEKHGISPAPEADRRTLARRLSLDLIGLPPKPAEVEAFVADQSPDYYEKYVDKLLQSPHWGEHRGRYWLDAARYADTHGIHIDNYREIWAYRDWVINAFNRNLPFDRFTIEQLAGDLLPDRTLEQQVASGFNRCNITTNEGGAIAEEYLVLYTRDRTETTSQVWLGLTTGCAVCHDHKFDPLSQREFYSLAAFFNNTTQAAMDGNVKDTPPIVTLPKAEDRPRWDALGKELVAARSEVDARKKAARPDFDKWLEKSSVREMTAGIPHDGLKFHAPLSEGTGNHFAIAEDGQVRTVTLPAAPGWGKGQVAASALKMTSTTTVAIDGPGDFERDQAFTCAAWVRFAQNGDNGALVARMAEGDGFRGWDLWLQNGRIGSHIVQAWDSDAIKVLSKASIKPAQWHHVALSYDGSSKAGGVKLFVDGVPQELEIVVDRLKSTIRNEQPLTFGQRKGGKRVDNLLIQDVRLYSRAIAADEADRIAKGTRAAFLAGKPAAKRSEAEVAELFDNWLESHDEPSQALSKRLRSLEAEQAAIKARGSITHVMQERDQPAMAYVLNRGEYDKRKDPVKPATPTALPAFPDDLPQNRLGLAQWLLRPDHPLTARVTVNRFWQEMFGSGIVRTAGDFGATGEAPSHPELLDWMAVDFRESGWDVKKFFRFVVTSATYRQAAVATPEKLEKDAANRLLSRGPRFRMDGEMIRDYSLASSGLMVPKIGGPSVKPYQPEGVWEAVAMRESDTKSYQRDQGEGLYRRSMYTFWKRAAPPAMLDIFNAPSRETCTVRRERTNTPLQALVTLNDVQFVEASRALAQVVLKEAGETDARLDALARRILARPLRDAEKAVLRPSLDDLLTFYKAHAEDARKLIAVGDSKADPSLDSGLLAAWTVLANQMMNLDEVLNK